MRFLKSILSILLVCCFLSSTSGISVYKHYCGDFLAEISIYLQSNPCADEMGEDACSKKKVMSCCDDETDFHKLEIDLLKQQDNKQVVTIQTPAITLLENALLGSAEFDSDVEVFIDLPPQDPIPIYIKYSSYTLYG